MEKKIIERIIVQRVNWNLLRIEQHGLFKNRSMLENMEVSENDPLVFIDDEPHGIARASIESLGGSGSKHYHCQNNHL